MHVQGLESRFLDVYSWMYMLVRMYRLTRICRIGDESTDYHFCLQFCILGMDRRLILQNTLRTRWKLRPVLTVCKFGAR